MTGDSKVDRAKILERVRALLAKADDRSVTDAEADAFRKKADELMTAYTISTWQLEAHKAGKEATPERRDFDVRWFYKSTQQDALWQLFHAVARHCRCKVIYWGTGRYTTPVLGLPADLDYLDQLFTSLMLQAVKDLEPKPNPSESIEENGYRLRSAGVNWMRTTELMYNAGLIDIPRGHVYLDPPDFDSAQRSFRREVLYSSRESMKNALAQRVRRYRRVNDLPDYTAIPPSVYQRSYAWGFVDKIRDRFRELRGEQRETAEEAGKPFDIVIRGIDQALDDMARELFGEEPKSKDLTLGQIDYRAHRDGSAAGARARIENSPGARIAPRKTLPS